MERTFSGWWPVSFGPAARKTPARAWKLGACALLLLATGCPESKEPMHADNPNADPLMMDAGGPPAPADMDAGAIETPTPAPSST